MSKRTPERAQFLRDVLTTAVEGGINYWAQVGDYAPDEGTVTVYESEEDDKPHAVTIETIAKGIGVAREKGLASLSGPDYVAQFWLADRTNSERGDYDADIADSILQLGLFGQITYG